MADILKPHCCKAVATIVGQLRGSLRFIGEFRVSEKNRFDISVPTSNEISNFSSGFLSKLKNNFEFFRTNKISYSLRLTGFQRIIQIFGFKRKLHLKTSGRFLSDSSLKFSVFYFLINCFPIF